MTKRVIDADALLDWLDAQKCRFDFCAFDVIKKINELATPACEPQAQESIFDAEGWCSDMDLAPKDCKILISNNYEVNTGIRVGKSFFWVLGVEDERVSCPIAWRPLPTPPKKKEA